MREYSIRSINQPMRMLLLVVNFFAKQEIVHASLDHSIRLMSPHVLEYLSDGSS